jgi:glucose dehydrogenase
VNDYVVTATGTAGVLQGEPNMRFDGTNSYQSSYSGGSVTGTSTLITIVAASGVSANFSYYVSDGTNKRAGTVMSVWDGSNTEYTDYSTPDIGGATTGISFRTTVSGANILFQAVVTSGTWTVKVGSRIVF